MNNKVAAAVNILAAVAVAITGIPFPWWANAILFASVGILCLTADTEE